MFVDNKRTNSGVIGRFGYFHIYPIASVFLIKLILKNSKGIFIINNKHNDSSIPHYMLYLQQEDD